MSRPTPSLSDRFHRPTPQLAGALASGFLLIGGLLGFGLGHLVSSSTPGEAISGGPTIRAAAQIELPHPGVAGTVDNLTLDILPSRTLKGIELVFSPAVQVIPASDLSADGLHPLASFTPAKNVKALIVANSDCQVTSSTHLTCSAISGGQVQSLTLSLIPLAKGPLNISATLSNTGPTPLTGLDGKTAVVVSFGLSVK